MDFKFDPSVLLPDLNLADSLAEERSPLPVLSNVFLSVSESSITIGATDLSSSFISETPISVSEPGSILVPARPLARWVSRVSSPIRARLDGASLRLKSGNSTLTLKTIPASEYPSLSFETPTHLGTLSASDFALALRKAAISADPSNSVPLRSSIAVDGDCLISSDGSRLSLSRLPLALSTPRPLLIPRDSVAQLWRALSSLDTVDIFTDGRRLIFKTASFTYAVQLFDETFFDWRIFFANPPIHDLVVPTAELRSAILRISDTRAEVPWVHILVSDSLLTLDNHFVLNDAATHAIESIVATTSTPFEIHASLTFIKDILTVVTEPTVTLALIPIGDDQMLSFSDGPLSTFIIAPMVLGG